MNLMARKLSLLEHHLQMEENLVKLGVGTSCYDSELKNKVTALLDRVRTQ